MKIAIIGAGTICTQHITSFRAAGAEVVAICDRRLESAEARAAEFGIPKAYGDTAAMLASASPRKPSVYIASKSCWVLILLVACLKKAVSTWSYSIPQPLSVTRI